MNEMNHKIYRNDFDKMIAGVASGLAESYLMDVVTVRLLFVLATIFLGGSGIIAYIVIWCIAPVHRFPKSNSPHQQPFQKFNQSADVNSRTEFPNYQKFNSSTMNAQEPPVFIPKNNFNMKRKSSTKLVFGVILIIIGLNALFNSFHWFFNIFDYFHKWWPLVLIGIGVFLLMKHKRKNQEMQNFMSGHPVEPTHEKPAKPHTEEPEANHSSQTES